MHFLLDLSLFELSMSFNACGRKIINKILSCEKQSASSHLTVEF